MLKIYMVLTLFFFFLFSFFLLLLFFIPYFRGGGVGGGFGGNVGGGGGGGGVANEFSIFVGDLSADVTDVLLQVSSLPSSPFHVFMGKKNPYSLPLLIYVIYLFFLKDHIRSKISFS